ASRPGTSGKGCAMCRSIAFAMVFAAATPAQALELVPHQAGIIDLGPIHGVTYYTEGPDGYRVVTTVADGETGQPLRFSIVLADQQTLTVSVQGKVGEAGQIITITRAGNRVIILSPAQPSDAAVLVSQDKVDHDR